uniref:Uncharacterized protein n=1 Tax=Ditylenchus dipsaci TaxID=166011 RepID=A0A915CS63_9BILA
MKGKNILQNHQKKIVRKKGTTTTESSADLRDVSLDKPSSANSMKNSSAEDKGLQGIYISQLPSSSNQLADKLSSVVRRHAKLIHIVYEHGANAKSALVLMQNVSNMEALLTTLNLTQLGGFQLKAKQANHVVVTEAYNNHLAVTSAAVSGAPLSKESLPLPPPPSIPGLFGEQSTSQPPIKPTSSGLLADKKK